MLTAWCAGCRWSSAWSGGLVPGLAAEVQRVAAGASDITVTSNERDPLSFFSGIGIGALETAGGPVPTGGNGSVRLYYAANMSGRMLNPNALDAIPLKDAIVLVGAQGQVIKTPMGPASVAQVMAEGVENLLGHHVLSRPSWAPPAEALMLVLTGIVMIGLLRWDWAGPRLAAWPACCFCGRPPGTSSSAIAFCWMRPRRPCFWPLAFAAALAAWLFELRMAYVALRMAFADSLPRASVEKMARRPELAEAGRRDPHRHLSGLRRARAGGPCRRPSRRPRRFHAPDGKGPDAADRPGAGAWRHHRPADAPTALPPSGTRRWKMPSMPCMPAKPPTAWSPYRAG